MDLTLVSATVIIPRLYSRGISTTQLQKSANTAVPNTCTVSFVLLSLSTLVSCSVLDTGLSACHMRFLVFFI